jgi:hypothetical protein
MKLKIGIFTFLFVLLFYIALFIAGFIPFVAEYKQDFSGEVVQDYGVDILLHPIRNIQEMHDTGNPLLYITLGAALGVFIYLLYKTRHRDYENVGEKYGVQGSSRWAKRQEVLTVPEQITVTPQQQMLSELKNTLNEVK